MIHFQLYNIKDLTPHVKCPAAEEQSV